MNIRIRRTNTWIPWWTRQKLCSQKFNFLCRCTYIFLLHERLDCGITAIIVKYYFDDFKTYVAWKACHFLCLDRFVIEKVNDQKDRKPCNGRVIKRFWNPRIKPMLLNKRAGVNERIFLSVPLSNVNKRTLRVRKKQIRFRHVLRTQQMRPRAAHAFAITALINAVFRTTTTTTNIVRRYRVSSRRSPLPAETYRSTSLTQRHFTIWHSAR